MVNIRKYSIIFFLAFFFSPILLISVTKEDTIPSALTESEKRKFDYFYFEALNHKEAERHSDAFLALEYALSVDSTSSAALYEISNYYIYLDRADLAINALKNAVKYNDLFEYKIALANLTRDMRLANEAIKIYEELIEKYPERPELNFFLSELYTQQGEIDKAIHYLDMLENNIGMNENLSIQKFRLYSMIEKKEAAFNELEKLTQKYPKEARYPIIIGDLYLDLQEPEKAYSYYQKAHEIDPENPYFIVSMANYYEYMQDNEAATKEIETALKNPKLDIEVKLAILGRYIQNLHQNKKEIERANVLFETLMEQHSQEKELNLMYGNLLLLQNKLEEAKFQYQVVTEASPDNIIAWKQLLNIALKENKPEDCINICDKALQHFPEDPDFYFYKGIAYSIKEEFQLALDSYLQGVDIVPKENPMLIADFYGQIGDTYHQLKQKEKAYEAYEKSLLHNDKNIVVLNNYAYFLALDRKDLSRAERMSSQTVKMQPENATYLDTYAWIFFIQGNYTLAKFYIESAITKDGGSNAEIIDHYGDILYKTGEKDKAVEQWKKALDLGKDSKILRKKIEDETYYEDNDPQ